MCVTCHLFYRLAIYYLNSVSEAYKNSNMELKKKMQMVNRDLQWFTVISLLKLNKSFTSVQR